LLREQMKRVLLGDLLLELREQPRLLVGVREECGVEWVASAESCGINRLANFSSCAIAGLRYRA
jgi:hypothetical protein